jgi:hypothetical protein
MSNQVYVFEIAVYRIGPEAWEKDVATRIEARDQAARVGAERAGLPVTPLADDGTNSEIHPDPFTLWIERPYDWQYNEIIGWVRLLWDGPGPVVKGYLWQVGKATIGGGGEARHSYRRGFIPHPFIYGEPLYKVLEEWFDEEQSDKEIFQQLRTGLLNIVGKNGSLPRRYIDVDIYDSVGPHIRWRELLHLEGDRHPS